MFTNQFLRFCKSATFALLAACSMGTAGADNGLNWKNGSDLLAVGLPALAAGAAWGQQDTEGMKQLTLTLASTVGAAELLKRTPAGPVLTLAEAIAYADKEARK